MVSKLRDILFGPRKPSKGSAQRETPFWMDQEVWREAFQDASLLANGPRQVEEAQERIVGRLMRAYEAHEHLHRQHAALLEGIVQALDFCEGLRPASPEVDALHGQLLGLLAEQASRPGCRPWANRCRRGARSWESCLRRSARPAPWSGWWRQRTSGAGASSFARRGC
jgi:hypothetical protein